MWISPEKVPTQVGNQLVVIERKLNIDPTVGAGPIVTSSMDVIGILIYLVLASKLW